MRGKPTEEFIRESGAVASVIARGFAEVDVHACKGLAGRRANSAFRQTITFKSREGLQLQLEPYLFFKGNCEEALNFYKDIFGGEIEGLSRWKDMPEGSEGPPVTAETANRVMHASFRAPGIAFMASDATPDKTYGEGPMSLSLGTSDIAEAERVFNRLAAGGNVEMPLADMFWGAKFGMLTDKFGIDWMINCSTG